MQQIELATDGQRFIWVTVKNGMSELRVHAFAAPRSAGLWQDVRQEIAEELSSAGTTAEETEGPFGTEVFAHVPVEPGNPAAGTTPVRFIGVDGPRWLLRGLIIGGAASGAEPVEPFEELLSDIVVVRGDHPMPPRDMLELRLPPEVQQALEQQQALAQQQAGGGTAEPEEENRFRTDLNPLRARSGVHRDALRNAAPATAPLGWPAHGRINTRQIPVNTPSLTCFYGDRYMRDSQAERPRVRVAGTVQVIRHDRIGGMPALEAELRQGPGAAST